VGADLVGARARTEVRDLARDAGEVEVARVLDDRHDEAALGVDRDADVLLAVVGDLVLGERRVDLRVGLERLDRGEREERQEREVRALARLEVGLRTVAQRGDARDVHLDGRGELGLGAQRLDHAAGDELAQAARLLGRAAQRRDRGDGRLLRATAGGGGCGGRGGLGLLRLAGGLEHVLLADAAADAGARDRRQVDALVRGELAHERREVGAAGLRRRGGRRAGGGRRRGGGARGRRGGLLLRGLRGAARLARRGARLGRGRLLLLRGLLLGRLLLRRLLLRGLRRGLRRRGGTRADDREHGAVLDRLVLLDEDLLDGARDGRRDLGVDLVGRDLEQRLVDLDRVADRLEPPRHGALGDGLAERRELDLLATGRLARGRGLLGRGGLLGGRLLLGGGLRGLGLGLRGRSLGLGGRRRGAATPGAVADHGEVGADLHGLVLLDEDLLEHARDGRRDLGVDLVGRDLEQRLVDGDGVADRLEPTGDGAFGDGLAEGRHLHVLRHDLPGLLRSLGSVVG